jgi:predicted cupin superfamily sugar epimerase
MPTIDELVRALALAPHPEGGYFRETYRAAEELSVLPSRFAGPRSVSTAIYYLLAEDAFSALHRIRSDEVWHFYVGDPLALTVISDGGELRTLVLGTDLAAGHVPQAVVEAGAWFGARLVTPGPSTFALVGCTVAPGFSFDDFELADRDALAARYPQHAETIRALTR